MRPFFRMLEASINATAIPPDVNPPRGLIEFYRYFLKQCLLPILALVTVTALVAAADMSMPFLIGQLVKLVQSETAPEHAQIGWKLPLLLVIMVVCRPIFQSTEAFIRNNILVPGITTLVRWQYHWHIMRKEWVFFQEDFAGRIANRVIQTAESFRDSSLLAIRAVVSLVIYGVTSIILFFSLDWKLGLPIVIWLAAYVAILVLFVPTLRSRAQKRSKLRSAVVARIVDVYTNILTIKLFSKPAEEDQYIRDILTQHQESIASHMRLTTRFSALLAIINASLLGSVGALGLMLWSRGNLDPSQLAVALPLAWQITSASTGISLDVATLFDNIGTVQDGIGSSAPVIGVSRNENNRELTVNHGAIEFKDISFGYIYAKPIIKNLSLKIKAGERLGIVGRSGAGKTTLTNLLLRLHECQSGAIIIDGQEIKDFSSESLRSAISVVSQDTSLLHRSIGENIKLGKLSASLADVQNAAKAARAHEFIEAMQDSEGGRGYKAKVGERGVKLSGGQRQRIAIARAILKDAPIIILDEATSALDSEVEHEIQRQLIDLMQGKTVLAIAHRLSTIAHMDRLIVIDRGEIVEMGTSDELLTQGGHYATLWRHQSKGFLAL